MDPLTLYPCRRADLAYRILGAEAVVVAPATSQVHELNPVASFVWERCNGDSRGDDILLAVLAEFEVEPQNARRDLRRLLAQLKDLNLLELLPHPPHSNPDSRSKQGPSQQERSDGSEFPKGKAGKDHTNSASVEAES